MAKRQRPVTSTKFLGVHISKDLSWSRNTASLVKKAHQRLYFLRRLRRAGVPPTIMHSFYRGTIESILTRCDRGQDHPVMASLPVASLDWDPTPAGCGSYPSPGGRLRSHGGSSYNQSPIRHLNFCCAPNLLRILMDGMDGASALSVSGSSSSSSSSEEGHTTDVTAGKEEKKGEVVGEEGREGWRDMCAKVKLQESVAGGHREPEHFMSEQCSDMKLKQLLESPRIGFNPDSYPAPEQDSRSESITMETGLDKKKSSEAAVAKPGACERSLNATFATLGGRRSFGEVTANKHGVERLHDERRANRDRTMSTRHPAELQVVNLHPTSAEDAAQPEGILNFYQQRCGFRRVAKRPDTKKGDVHQEAHKPPTSEAGAPGPPPAARVPLFRPLMFTVGFTGCTFGAAAILQYETLKSRVQTIKDEVETERFPQSIGLQGSQDMAYWHDWWNQLTGFQRQLIFLMSIVDDFWGNLTEGQKTVSGIIAVNAVVLCCWRIPSMQRYMMKLFMSNPASKKQCLPMVLSSFSHYSIIHMMANMYVLWTFSSGIVSLLGREQFIAFYLSAGVISSMVSYICKTASGRFYPSLGASGAVMAVLAAVCAKVPEAKLGMIFLPMVTLTAGTALKALVAVDSAGLILGWRLFDHAAHIGGALFGVWYVAYGYKLIWRKREPFVKLWHDMRSPGAGGSGPGGRPQ
ncbi:presenilin-associated rhomboid-like protein A, mitochondrial [Lampetra planeri]